jgi:iron complex outermembrane recepter protein
MRITMRGAVQPSELTFALTVLGAVLCSTGSARADAPLPGPLPASGDEEPERAGTAAYEATVRAPVRLADAWASGDGPTVQVIGSGELKASGARTLQEALQRLPGIHLSDEQGNSFQTDLSTRGFTVSPVTGLPQGLSVFLDGVRLNEPAVEEVNFDLVPLADVERIEIIHGVNAVFGRNTLGGAIHIITRRGGAKADAETEIEGGSSLYQEVRARAAGPLGPLDGYLSLGQGYERGWRTDGAARSLRAFGKLGARREDLDAALSYQFQSDRLGQAGSLPLSLLRADRTQNYTPGDFFRPELHLVTLNARGRLAPGLSLAVNAFFRALDSQQFNASFVSADTRLFDRTRTVGGTVQLDQRLRLGPLRNRLTAGADVARSTVDVRVREEANGRVDTTDGGLPLPRLTSDVSDGQLGIGIFLQDHVGVVAGPLAGLGATAALRFDRISHDVVDASPDDPGKATGNMVFSRLVPMAGVSWAFAPRWLASASYGQGFRAPAFLELTCADPAAPCIGLQAGVAPDTSLTALRPVRSRSLEAGVSGSPLDGVTATLDLFRIDLRDDIFALTAPGSTRVVFQNVGDTRRQGLELSLRGERGVVEVQGSYAYTRATFESDVVLATPRTASGDETVRRGAQLPLVPNHRLDLECRVHARRWITVSAGLSLVGSQYFRGDEANVAEKLAPYLVLRAGAEARWRSWTASLRVANLLDNRYETFGTFAPNGRIPGQPIEPFLTPGAPLRVVAGLRWELDRAPQEPMP